MNNPLEQLIGQRVTKSGTVHDYAQVIFGNTSILTINNVYTVKGTRNLLELTGLALAGASENTDEVVLTFEDGTSINVNLLPEAYRGPEAMVLHRDGHPIVVWD